MRGVSEHRTQKNEAGGKRLNVVTKDGEIHLEPEYPDHHVRLEAFDRCERLYGASPTKHEVPPPPRGHLSVVIVRASDLERARQRQERRAVEVNPKKTLEVSIVKKDRVPSSHPPSPGTDV